MEGREMDDAQVLVADQAECSLQQALELMTRAARAGDESVQNVAEQVLAGKIWFSPASAALSGTAQSPDRRVA